LAFQSVDTAAQLRINVTSPGGTTAAALGVLMNEETGFPAVVRRAVKAAADRGRELGK
jgi:pyrroline-5-carboxylate reductase